jgi:hypothetical protein
MSLVGRDVRVLSDILNSNGERKIKWLKSTKREFGQRDKMNYMG